ncbi:ArsA-related P-loop ATPase, partial [Klenkia sp. PcliD-1-E]|uniref:ArsA-related P-loop ATPase n=1 Tax=Klenkia sp. PcliD-1-E TaxID=2954492 RepID=UPI00273A7129
MRTLLVTGPGGAGSSTVAAATAHALAGSGQRVVLVATEPPPVADLGDVDVRVVQAGPALEAAWAGHADALAALVPVLTLPPATSTVPPPG